MKTLISLTAMLTASAACAEPILPDFAPANFAAVAEFAHQYFPLHPGFHREYEGTVIEEDGQPAIERTVMTWGGAGPDIAGVPTLVILDEAYLDGVLIETTKDFYAQDRQGNIWYMGEDVTNLNYDEDDKLIGTDAKGSWRAGVNGALPGYAMPADPQPGFAYEQEHAPQDQALDRAEVMSVSGTLDGPLGPYAQVLSVYETSAVEPDLREIKYYAPGVGLIAEDEAVDENRANPEARFDLVQMKD